MLDENREAGLVNAKAAANYFLTCAWGEGLQIDQLKLQKLLYYAHGWHLANDFGPLFPDDIEAWPHGPVVRDIYVEFHSFGSNPIDRLATNYDGLAPNADDADEATISLLRGIWDAYKEYSGTRLSNSTHARGEPWSIIRERYNDLSKKPRIPNELIKQKFKEKLEPAF